MGMLRSIGRNTHPTICLVAVAVEDVVLLLILALGAQLVVGSEDQLLCAFIPPEMPAVQPAYWLEAPEEKCQGGPVAAHPPWEACDSVDLAWVWGLLGCGPGPCRPHTGADPLAELTLQADPLLQPWPGDVSGLLLCPILCVSDFPVQHLPLLSPVPGAHPEAETEL